MQLVGYSDRWSVRSGETIRFFVSARDHQYDAQLIRLFHGDTNPNGPGPKSTEIAADLNGTYAGRQQSIYTGSYIRINFNANLIADRGFSVFAYFKATCLAAADQGLVAQWDNASQVGFGLFIRNGRIEARLGPCAGKPVVLTSQRPLRQTEWHFAALSYDPNVETLTLLTEICRPTVFDAVRETLIAHVQPPTSWTEQPLLLGAGSLAVDDGRTHAIDCFNGKLSCPAMLSRPLNAAEIASLSPKALLERADDAWLARWDLAHEPAGRFIPDVSGNGHDGTTVNRPTRAVTGHNWRARTDSWRETPEEYNAIHFHDDDLEDADWVESFRFVIPAMLPSGVYAVRLTANGQAGDCLPFFVSAPIGKPRAAVVVLMPTLSYMAYSNATLNLDDSSYLAALCPLRDMTVQRDEHAYIASNAIKSTYNVHRDGSGICHCTLLRPSLTSFRPSHRDQLFGGPHQLSADLHLIDWLEVKGISYDIITDHDLHREGAGLLDGYRCVLTGTHAEYWTLEMLDALEHYQQHGGRLVYLSGNGLYWVTALDPENQNVCEVRRPNGTRAWTTEPGEGRLSFTGEPGGTWTQRGRPPQRYVGVGFAAQGFDRGVPFKRTESSRDPRCAFLFDGIAGDLLGNTPALVLNYGAAGTEIDRVDYESGTPSHALVVATSIRLSDAYQCAVEEIPVMMPNQGGLINANVRADMVFYETPQEGAVFSAGSISFCSTLSYNNYQNDTSRLLENVIRAFSTPGSLIGKS